MHFKQIELKQSRPFCCTRVREGGKSWLVDPGDLIELGSKVSDLRVEGEEVDWGHKACSWSFDAQ